MNYEKKYKEALEKAKSFNKRWQCVGATNSELVLKELKEIFPELKESEDEKIRKTLIRFFKDQYSNETEMYDGSVTVGKALAWLEKQGEQKPILDFKASNWYVSKADGKIHDMTYNPTNKVEPKFKIGDWIVNDYCMGRVVELTNDAYLLDTEQGIPFSCEHNVHLWTIQDAKDGDVLVDSLSGDNQITILFKCIELDTSICAYCGWNCYNFRVTTDGTGYGTLSSTKYVPATKEQCELLFRRMKAAGYEWDAEKKELKKIEQKLTELAKGEDYGKCWNPSIDVDTMVEEYVKQYAYIDMRSCDSIRKVYREGILNTLDKINK